MTGLPAARPDITARAQRAAPTAQIMKGYPRSHSTRGERPEDRKGTDMTHSTKDLEAPTIHGLHWRHRNGGKYIVMATGLIEATLTPCVIYQTDPDEDDGDGMVWVRPYDEFMDGRFTCIDGEARGLTDDEAHGAAVRHAMDGPTVAADAPWAREEDQRRAFAELQAQVTALEPAAIRAEAVKAALPAGVEPWMLIDALTGMERHKDNGLSQYHKLTCRHAASLLRALIAQPADAP